MRRRLLVPTLLAAVALVASACGSSGGGGTDSSGGGTDKVNVGVIPIVDVAPIYIGRDKGFFSKRHIDLHLVQESGGAAAIPGVQSGDFQFAFGNVVSLLLANTQGLPLQAIAEGNSSTGNTSKDFSAVVVPKDSTVQSAKDLEGKTVAVNNLKNIGDVTIRAAMEKAGADPSTVHFVEMGFPDMPAAVAKHRVDAAWVVEPFVTVATSQGARIVSYNFASAAKDLTIATYFTTKQRIAEDPSLVKRFRAAIQESLQYASDHPQAVRAELPKYTKIPEDAAAKITLPKFPQDINVDSMQTLADDMAKYGLVDKKPDVPGAIWNP